MRDTGRAASRRRAGRTRLTTSLAEHSPAEPLQKRGAARTKKRPGWSGVYRQGLRLRPVWYLDRRMTRDCGTDEPKIAYVRPVSGATRAKMTDAGVKAFQ